MSRRISSHVVVYHSGLTLPFRNVCEAQDLRVLGALHCAPQGVQSILVEFFIYLLRIQGRGESVRIHALPQKKSARTSMEGRV